MSLSATAEALARELDGNDFVYFNETRQAGGAAVEVDLIYSNRTGWVTLVMGSGECEAGMFVMKYPVDELGWVVGGEDSQYLELYYCLDAGCVSGI